LRVSRRA
jgi:hypothetical protein